jgi:hypothetical protein
MISTEKLNARAKAMACQMPCWRADTMVMTKQKMPVMTVRAFLFREVWFHAYRISANLTNRPKESINQGYKLPFWG